jgi:hypothetical protein
LVLVALFALDALLFNTGLYSHLLEPESTSGRFEMILGRERIAQQRNGDDLVALLGDSRFGCAPGTT